MDKLTEKLDEYLDRFKEPFPTIPLMWGRDDGEVIEIIDRCVREGKDVYQLGYCEKDPEGAY